MRKYYGLRLMQFLYTAAAWVIAIFSVAAVGAHIGNALLNESSLNVVWMLGILIGGGFIGLTLYVFAQLIDILVREHQMQEEQGRKLDELTKKVDRIGQILAQHKPQIDAINAVNARKQRLTGNTIPVERETTRGE